MTINDIYNAVKFISNKEQKGYIKPSEFNTLAKQAQLELINEKLDKIRKYKSLERTGTNYRGSTEDVEDFYNEIGVLSTEATLTYNSNKFQYPADVMYIQWLIYESGGIPTPIEIVDKHNVNHVLRSNLVAPSADYPIAIRTSGGYEVFPTSITSSVKLQYYKEPASPVWGYQASGDDYIYNSNTSTEFELPDSCHNDIIIKILKYVGINLRDADLSSYAVQTETQDYVKTK